MNLITFSEKLRVLRKSAGLTQEQLANRAGLSKYSISKYENGIKAPSIDTLEQFAHIFRVSIDYLVGLENRKMIDISDVPTDKSHVITELVDVLSK